ncbi:MAG: biotin attachment protein [Chloroflexi bacterium]|nr:biotin attachment protein [Chloroflexota bacterium]
MRRYKLQIKDKEYTIDVQDLSANEFRVMLNDQAFDVQLSAAQELLGATITPQISPVNAADESAIERPATSYHPPSLDVLGSVRLAPAPALPPTPRTSANGASQEITAPMPGTILTVEVKPGDAVTHGQTVCILEAMKMKNAIRSPRDATVAEVIAQAGQAVRYGDVLVRFEEGK